MENINKKIWNEFILQNNGSFLQYYEWGEFQESFGRKVLRLADFEEGWVAQFFQFKIPYINRFYWHCPRGPVINDFSRFAGSRGARQFSIFKKIQEELKKEKAIFFRLGAPWKINKGYENGLQKAGLKKLNYDVEPAQTLILNLEKSEEEILEQMHSKWRYNIGLAKKKGVKIKIVSATDANFEESFENFFSLVELTYGRQEVRHHPREYYKKQLQILDGDLKMRLFLAEYNGKPVAGNIIVFFDRRSVYLHGATNNEFRALMAPHLLQWEQICEAKKQGCIEYDFWGIVNENTIDKRKNSWEGFTRFKKGFGGREENYIGCWDFPLDKKWYFVYQSVQKIRR